MTPIQLRLCLRRVASLGLHLTGFTPTRFKSLGRMIGLRSVDSDIADLLRSTLDRHLDGARTGSCLGRRPLVVTSSPTRTITVAAVRGWFRVAAVAAGAWASDVAVPGAFRRNQPSRF